MNLIDFRLRRSVHVALLTDTYKNLRSVLLEKDISVQSAFQKFAELIVSGDKRADKILDELLVEKREGQIKKARFVYASKTTPENLYDLIGDDLDKERAAKNDFDEDSI